MEHSLTVYISFSHSVILLKVVICFEDLFKSANLTVVAAFCNSNLHFLLFDILLKFVTNYVQLENCSKTCESMYAANTFCLCQSASQVGTDHCSALSVAAPYTGIAGELKNSADGKH